ncbi:MAG: anti-sigma factor ChrR (cupin superfamily) [Planctomycetota bacterium]|jgi:anti-sigma factor ChrR (cupin superfamily)
MTIALHTQLRFRVTDTGVPWRATDWPGISWQLLAAEAEEGSERAAAGRGATVLIRMEPGCGYPAHTHLDVEEVLVLAGGYRDERGVYEVGQFVRYPGGSRHTPVALGDAARSEGEDNPACLLFASARGGIELDSSDPTQEKSS